MAHDLFQICQHLIGVLQCTHTDVVGIGCCIVHDLLCLLVGVLQQLIGLCICLLHNFTFRNHLLCLCLCVCDDRICFGLCVCQDRIFVADDLLVTFDLIRCLHTKLTQKLFQFFFIYHDLCRREWLEFTTVYILLDFFNNLLNSAAHRYHSYFLF